MMLHDPFQLEQRVFDDVFALKLAPSVFTLNTNSPWSVVMEIDHFDEKLIYWLAHLFAFSL